MAIIMRYKLTTRPVGIAWERSNADAKKIALECKIVLAALSEKTAMAEEFEAQVLLVAKKRD